MSRTRATTSRRLFGTTWDLHRGRCLEAFGHAVDTRPLTTISDVFRDVDAGNLDYGVVPIENSTERHGNAYIGVLLGFTTLYLW